MPELRSMMVSLRYGLAAMYASVLPLLHDNHALGATKDGQGACFRARQWGMGVAHGPCRGRFGLRCSASVKPARAKGEVTWCQRVFAKSVVCGDGALDEMALHVRLQR